MEGASGNVLDRIVTTLDHLRELQGLQLNARARSTANEIERVLTNGWTEAIRAQAYCLTLSGELTALRQQVTNLRNQLTDRKRYALEQITPGSFAYGSRFAVEANEARHFLCAPCFDQGVRSILQFEHFWHRHTMLRCHRCSACIFLDCDYARKKANEAGA
ncbi:hypothetical protein [Paraburkholderia aspalathi]|uniref:hypothetical protein n=1 Tax=Paraburkholderia aspalathi TaxID=1324617 RepID=UPI0038B822B8